LRARTILTACGSAAILTVLASGIALSADAIRPYTYLDLPFLDRDEIGARWAAMGGACMGLVDDGAAVWYNPAGLGRIRRIEILGSFNRRSLKIESDWYGDSNTSSVSSTRFEDLAISYPFPTYRGSLVLSGSILRATSYDQLLDRMADLGGTDYKDLEERKVVLTAWSGAAAVQVSPNVFIGAEAHFYTGDLMFEDTWQPFEDCVDEPAVFGQSGDLGGYGGSVGLLVIPHPLVAVGVTARTPQRINLEGSDKYTYPGCDLSSGRIDDNYDLPYSVGIGVGIMPPSASIGLDVVFTDWHELDYPDKQPDDIIYDATTDIRVGGEFELPVVPFRLRAGYAYVPLSLNKFEIEKDKHRISFGAGTIIESTLTVDAAWQRTGFERSDPGASYSEKRTTDRLILSFAYRF
jgi:hypothetical protein